jgi:hypothetical protein
MNKYKVVEYDDETYQRCKFLQIENNKVFKEHYFGSRKKLIINDKVRATNIPNGKLYIGDLSDKKFIAFLAYFSKHLYKNLINKPYLYEYKLEFKGSARYKNFKLWSDLKDNIIFYNIDLKSAYWQICNQLGYIDKKFFDDYMFNDEYKQAKRLCISFLARKNIMTYYSQKRKAYSVQCDITPLKTCYNNIRNQLYTCVSNAVSLCNNVIEYNIDGVYVLAEDVDKVRKAFDEMNLIYKITKCVKLNEYEFMYGSKLRNFKIKRV